MARPDRKGMRFLGVDIDKADFEALQKIAAEDKRTVASLMRVVISDWLAWHAQRTPAGRLKPGDVPPDNSGSEE
jgi:hypothetical protein